MNNTMNNTKTTDGFWYLNNLKSLNGIFQETLPDFSNTMGNFLAGYSATCEKINEIDEKLDAIHHNI